VCTWVGNQQNCGVLTARVRTNAVRSLHHQRRDIHQSIYLYLSEDQDSSNYHYGRPYRTPLSWSESGERVIFGPDIMTKAEEKVRQIQANILIAQSRQKSYTDKRHRALEF
jgi:hypothetical protein